LVHDHRSFDGARQVHSWRRSARPAVRHHIANVQPRAGLTIEAFLFGVQKLRKRVALGGRAWDPYPFILLNLILSMLAAIQAPVIMMSQNRQDTKDRLRSELDFDVNRRAESEIQGLAGKLNLLNGKMGDLDDQIRAMHTLLAPRW
jgi:hypothetical protein